MFGMGFLSVLYMKTRESGLKFVRIATFTEHLP